MRRISRTPMTLLTLIAILSLKALPALGEEAQESALDQRVNTLIEAAAGTPTNATNRLARAEIIWDWLNAVSLRGVHLPVNLTQMVTFVLRNPGAPGADPLIDAAIEELEVLDRQPEVLGTLTATTGPYPARSYGTVRQTYTVGSRDIQPGGGFLVARHFMSNFGAWQVTDPAAANYVSISSTNSGVRFATATEPVRGMHGGFRSAAPGLAFRVVTGKLTAGDQVTVTYGDTSAGSRGLLMPSFSSDAMPLPLYVSFREGGHFFSLPLQRIQITGSQLAGVHAFAPSIATPGETVVVSIRAQDQFFNRATGELPAWQLFANGTPIATVEAGRGPINEARVRFDTPGVYHLTVQSADQSIQGEGNPILVTANPENRIYWGDTHGHSGFAEGIGTAERFMQWARDDARLDYVTHSEHDIWMDDHEWEVLRKIVERYSEEGQFIAYLGYEWTVSQVNGGHHNVLYRTPQDRRRIGSQFHPTLSKLYQGLRATAATEDVVVIPHAHNAGDYRLSDPELEPLIEIMSMHGNFEWFGRMYLNHGHQVGFTAASDNHLSQPGYSLPIGGSLSQRGGLGAVLAPDKTNDAIFDGMKRLQTYATTGARMILDFSVNDAGMGARTTFSRQRNIRGRVIGTAPIREVAIVKNDALLWSQRYDEADDKAADTEHVAVTFASPAVPVQRGDNPRGWRRWSGTLTIDGATVKNAHLAPTHSPEQSGVSVQGNSIQFTTMTRGAGATLHLELSDVRRSAQFALQTEAAKEFGGAPPIFRPQAEIAPLDVSFRWSDLRDGDHRIDVPATDYVDTVTVRRVVADGPRDISFEALDEATTQGDYYFVRVTQVDDAIAWSSPVWVGGYSPR